MDIKRNILSKKNLAELENLVNRLDEVVMEARVGLFELRPERADIQPPRFWWEGEEGEGDFYHQGSLIRGKTRKFCHENGFILVMNKINN